MNRTFRIFRKDVRHLWPEILLALGIAFAFAALEPWSWPGYDHYYFRESATLVGTVNVLLPLSWWLLIARSVHDESLVGDRQFWLTRPCTWYRVLAAKLLFLLAFVALPTFLIKIHLLAAASLPIAANLPAVLLSVLATSSIWIALFAIATVTANLTRMFLTLIAGALYVALALYIDYLLGSVHTFGPPDDPAWLGILPFAVCAAVILLQYARRLTAVSRSALIALVLLITVVTMVREQAWSPNRAFTALAPSEAPPLTFTLDPHPPPEPPELSKEFTYTAPGQLAPYEPPAYNKEISAISIPVIIAGVLPNHSVHIDNITASFRLPGQTTDTEQNLAESAAAVPGSHPNAFDVYLGAENYHAFEDRPLTVSLDVAVTETEAAAAESIVVRRFTPLPGNGTCVIRPLLPSSEPDDGSRGLRTPFADCRYPLGKPEYTYVVAPLFDQPCSQPSTSLVSGHAWIGATEGSAFNLNFDPVVHMAINLDNEQHQVGKDWVPRQLCPGAVVTFTPYRLTRRRLVHITLPPILPRDYTGRHSYGTIGRSEGVMY